MRYAEPPLCADLLQEALTIDGEAIAARPFRVFTVIDGFHREALTMEIAGSLSAERVVRAWEQLITWCEQPTRILP